MAFAEVSDLEARWRPLSQDEQSRAAVLLDDASAVLSALVEVDGSEGQAELLKLVCCNMVERTMSATESDGYGLTQQSMTAGSYAQSWSYSNPSGDFYITKLEKRMLGIASGYISTIQPMIGGSDD